MKVVRKLVEVKQIEVLEFATDQSVSGTQKMIVKWVCPTCGEKMGTPSKISLMEEEAIYTVDLWTNACGHITQPEELLQFEKKFNVSGLQKAGG